MSQIRKIRYRLFAWRKFPKLTPATDPIDVVIPIIAKDLHILPLCLEGVRTCVLHPIKDIYIVAPAQQEIIQFCESHQLRFVDENSIWGFSPKELNLIIHNPDGSTRDRSGWLFQQLVKLCGKIGTCRYYLCIDADHVLIHPHVFLTEDQKTVFYMSYEEHQPYYENIHRLLPDVALDTLSYVDHKMLFDKEQLALLHQTLSKLSGRSWVDTIIDGYDRTNFAGFSEFETYGNFVQRKVRRPWLQKRLSYKKLTDYATLQRKWQSSRWSLTFPDYINK
ncbi:MAG: hypothetical protein IJV44_04805 [Prevotella sp.]|nr:hypothetical protein [Prevotella sp.]